MLERDWRTQCAELTAGDSNPARRSRAPTAPTSASISSCPLRLSRVRRTITAWQNIPVLSYLLLRGKCAKCGARISARYPIVELAHRHSLGRRRLEVRLRLVTVAALVLTWFLVALGVIDFDTQLLPDTITLPLIWIGLLLSLSPTDPAHGLPVDLRSQHHRRGRGLPEPVERLSSVQAAHRQGRHGLRRLQAVRRAGRVARVADAAVDHPAVGVHRRRGRHRPDRRARARSQHADSVRPVPRRRGLDRADVGR